MFLTSIHAVCQFPFSPPSVCRENLGMRGDENDSQDEYGHEHGGMYIVRQITYGL